MTTTVRPGDADTISLPAGNALTITVADGAIGRIIRFGDQAGSPSQGYTDLTSGTLTIGPFEVTTFHAISCQSGAISYAVTRADYQTSAEVLLTASQSPKPFSEEKVFSAGDPVVYRGRLFQHTAAKLAGAWNRYKVRPLAAEKEFRLTFAATGSIIANAAILRRLRVLSGSALTLVLRDSPNAASGTTLLTSTGLSLATSEIEWPGGYPLVNGLYATVTGTGVFEVGFQ